MLFVCVQKLCSTIMLPCNVKCQISFHQASRFNTKISKKNSTAETLSPPPTGASPRPLTWPPNSSSCLCIKWYCTQCRQQMHAVTSLAAAVYSRMVKAQFHYSSWSNLPQTLLQHFRFIMEQENKIIVACTALVMYSLSACV